MLRLFSVYPTDSFARAQQAFLLVMQLLERLIRCLFHTLQGLIINIVHAILLFIIFLFFRSVMKVDECLFWYQLTRADPDKGP